MFCLGKGEEFGTAQTDPVAVRVHQTHKTRQQIDKMTAFNSMV